MGVSLLAHCLGFGHGLLSFDHAHLHGSCIYHLHNPRLPHSKRFLQNGGESAAESLIRQGVGVVGKDGGILCLFDYQQYLMKITI